MTGLNDPVHLDLRLLCLVTRFCVNILNIILFLSRLETHCCPKRHCLSGPAREQHYVGTQKQFN